MAALLVSWPYDRHSDRDRGRSSTAAVVAMATEGEGGWEAMKIEVKCGCGRCMGVWMEGPHDEVNWRVAWKGRHRIREKRKEGVQAKGSLCKPEFLCSALCPTLRHEERDRDSDRDSTVAAHLVGAESEEEGLGTEEGHHLVKNIDESGDAMRWVLDTLRSRSRRSVARESGRQWVRTVPSRTSRSWQRYQMQMQLRRRRRTHPPCRRARRESQPLGLPWGTGTGQRCRWSKIR
jgi:hypothetical protein